MVYGAHQAMAWRSPVTSVAKVAAVIVTYQPDTAQVERILQALEGEVDSIVLVDNGSSEVPEQRWRQHSARLVVRRLAENKGIGAAQNEGVAVAKAAGATHVLLLDQDSLPAAGMVPVLLGAAQLLAERGVRVACVGPQRRRPDSEAVTGFTRLGWLGLRKIRCEDPTRPVECDFVVASGSLIPLASWEQVGGMEVDLFIDLVDTEWCLRARAKGYGVYGTAAVLDHTIGEAGKRAPLLGLPRHKPFRYYYIFRNTMLLARRPYVPLQVVVFQLGWLAALFLLVGVLRGGWSELRMMGRGARDGLRGVTGKLATGAEH